REVHQLHPARRLRSSADNERKEPLFRGGELHYAAAECDRAAFGDDYEWRRLFGHAHTDAGARRSIRPPRRFSSVLMGRLRAAMTRARHHGFRARRSPPRDDVRQERAVRLWLAASAPAIA